MVAESSTGSLLPYGGHFQAVEYQTKVDLWNERPDEERAAELTLALQRTQTLTSLRLWSNNLRPSDGDAVLTAASMIRALVVLKCCNNNLNIKAHQHGRQDGWCRDCH
jgi:hypothetical protein